MSSAEIKSEEQSALFSCSVHSNSCTLMPLSAKPGNIKLSSSEPGCIKAKFCKKGVKLTEKPVSFSIERCEACESENETLPALTVSEGETHEHIYSDTFVCNIDSQSVQPSDKDSKSCSTCCTGAFSSLASVIPQKPVNIDLRLKDHVPKSIEELKASKTSLTGEEISPVGNQLGCKFIEFCCDIHTTGSVFQPDDSDPCGSDRPPVRQGISLTMEPNDHRFCTNPYDCKHTREPACAPYEPPCQPNEPPCPPNEPPCSPNEPPCAPKDPPCPGSCN